jgi:hypothetical protein
LSNDANIVVKSSSSSEEKVSSDSIARRTHNVAPGPLQTVYQGGLIYSENYVLNQSFIIPQNVLNATMTIKVFPSLLSFILSEISRLEKQPHTGFEFYASVLHLRVLATRLIPSDTDPALVKDLK